MVARTSTSDTARLKAEGPDSTEPILPMASPDSPHRSATSPSRLSSPHSHFSWVTDNFMDSTDHDSNGSHPYDPESHHDDDLRNQLRQQGIQLEALREENHRLRQMLILANARTRPRTTRHEHELDVPDVLTHRLVGPHDDLADALLAARELGCGQEPFLPRQVYPMRGSLPSLFAGFDTPRGPLRREPRHGGARAVSVYPYILGGLGVASLALAVAWGVGWVYRER